MEFNIEIRKKQLENLDQFVSSSRDKLQSILDSLGWSVDEIKDDKPTVICPYNAEHKVLPDQLEEHMKKCSIKNSGYDLQEEFLSEPGNQSIDSSINIDTLKKIEVLSQAFSHIPFFKTAWNGQDPDPQTYSRLVTTFSTDERLALYNYSVFNTKAPPELPEFDTSKLESKYASTSYTIDELRSFERDIKRRSVKYKPVHTSHKNYKEVLKEVIDSQMQQYEDWLRQGRSPKGPRTPEYRQKDRDGECGRSGENSSEEYLDRPRSSTSRHSSHSYRSRRRERGSTRRREESPKRSLHESKSHSYERDNFRNDEDDVISNDSRRSSTKKNGNRYKEDLEDLSAIDSVSLSLDSEKNEHFEDVSKSHSRASSSLSSYKHRAREEKYKDDDRSKSRRHRSRSRSSDRSSKKRYRSRRSRSGHRSRDRRSHRSSKRSSERYSKHEKYNSYS